MTENKLVKRYVTRDVLKVGVRLVEGEIYPRSGAFSWSEMGRYYFSKTFFYETWGEASRGAEAIRARKIAWHRAQIAKLDSLVFVKPEGEVE